jgi:predicted ATP-dependent serine protease
LRSSPWSVQLFTERLNAARRQETQYDFNGKRAGFRLGAKDVFLNITGGISVDDPAIDLAVVAAILSSNEDIPVDVFCFAGEVGLSGKSVQTE